MSKQIPVGRFRRVTIDDEDYDRCAPFRWRMRTYKKKREGRTVRQEYAFAYVLVNGKQKLLFLARYLANCPPDQRVSFINHDHTDYRKENLRVSGRPVIPADEAFARKHKLPDIFTLLEDYENGE